MGFKALESETQTTTGGRGFRPLEADQPEGPGLLSHAADALASIGSGSNALLKMGGDFYGLVTGDIDNAVSRAGRSGQDYWNQTKSAEQQGAEAGRKAAVDAAPDEIGKAWAYVKETVSSPRLFSTTLLEQVPMYVVPGGAGAAVGKVALARGATAATAGKLGVGTAVGAGATMQGADVGGDQAGELSKIIAQLPDEQAASVPEIAELMQRGASLAEAKAAYVLVQARKTGVLAGGISLGTQMLPGARTIERALVGQGGGRIGSRAAGAGVGATGEAVSESLEEGGGQAGKNLLAQGVDPNRPITQGVGEAVGQAAIAAGPMGGVAGALAREQAALTRNPLTDIQGQPAAANPLTGEPIPADPIESRIAQRIADAVGVKQAVPQAPVVTPAEVIQPAPVEAIQPAAPEPRGFTPIDVPRETPDRIANANLLAEHLGGQERQAARDEQLDARDLEIPAETVRDWQDKRAPGALSDPRLLSPQIVGELQAMASESGWDEEGGKMIRAPDDGGLKPEVIGRTQWIAKADWYKAMQGSPKSRIPGGQRGVQAVIDRALAGKPLTTQERRSVRFMLGQAQDYLLDSSWVGAAEYAGIADAVKLPAGVDFMLDASLASQASEIDEAAYERASIQHANDDAGFLNAIAQIVDGATRNPYPEAGRGRAPVAGVAPKQKAAETSGTYPQGRQVNEAVRANVREPDLVRANVREPDLFGAQTSGDQAGLFDARPAQGIDDQAVQGRRRPDFQQSGQPDSADRAKRTVSTVVAKPIPGGKKLRPRILNKQVADSFERGHPAALIGQKVTSAEDVAGLGQIYRDPTSETFRVFFVDANGKIVDATATTSREANSVAPFTSDESGFAQWMRDRMAANGATGYYLLHNHPSGSPKASKADIELTRLIASDVPGFKSHVIVNSNAYGVIESSGNATAVQRQEKDDSLLRPRPAFNWQGTNIVSSNQVAAIGKSLQRQDGWIGVILQAGTTGVRTLAEMPTELLRDPMKAAAWINRLKIGGAGGGDAFLYFDKMPVNADILRSLTDLLKGGHILDAVAPHHSSVWSLRDSAPTAAALGKRWKDGRSFSRVTRLREEETPYGPIFYSELARQVQAVPMKQAAPQEWANWLKSTASKGVKPAEIEATGLGEWLQLQQGKVTKQAVLDYLKANGVQVTETVLGAPAGQAEFVASLEALSTDELIDEAADADVENPEQMSRAQLVRAIVNSYEGGMPGEGDSSPGDAKFSDYQLPGGKKYRELLLRLPSKVAPPDFSNWKSIYVGGGEWEVHDAGRKFRGIVRADSEATQEQVGRTWWDGASGSTQRMLDSTKADFRSSHFDQPNILAHVRFNERTDADGKRVLFIEEIQSDWAQKGRKGGFADGKPPAGLTIKKVNVPSAKDDGVRFIGEWSNGGRAVGPYRTEQEVIDDATKKAGSGIPAAPFVGKTEAWVALALKRMIRYAAENGFDRVAWTTGEQQVDRYALSKRVNQIVVTPRTHAVTGEKTRTAELDLVGNSVIRFGVDANGVIDNTSGAQGFGDAKGKPLADVIGKEIAERVMQMERGTIQGDDLNVGGQGMATFYDKIVPNVANDVLKKLGGGRVETLGKVTEPNKLTGNQFFTITPAMREKAMGGQALFERQSGYKSPREAMLWQDITLDGGFVGKNLMLDPIADLKVIRNDAARELGSSNPNLLKAGHAAHVPTGNTARRYSIRDRSGKQLGVVDLQLDGGGDIVALHDVVIEKRGEGTGTELIELLTANSPSVKIIDIIESARSFWEQVGVGTIDPYGNGTLDWQGYRAAVGRKRASSGNVGTGSGRTDLARTEKAFEAQRVAEEEVAPYGAKATGLARIIDPLTHRLKAGEKVYEALERFVGGQLAKVGLASSAPPAFRRMLAAYRTDKGKAAETARTVAEAGMDLPEAERNLLSDVVEQELKAGVVPPAHILEIARTIDAAIADQTKTLVELKALSPEAAKKWAGRYLPRYYAKHMGDKGVIAKLFRIGVRGNHMKARGLFEIVDKADLVGWQQMGFEVRADIPTGDDGKVVVWRDWTKGEREKMGENRDGIYRFARGMLETGGDIAALRLFKAISESEYATNSTAAGLRDGWEKVPDTAISGTQLKKYGALAGMYVHPDVWKELAFEFRDKGPWETSLAQLTALWKEGKTAMNPATHAANVVSSIVMSDFAGISPLRVDKYLSALKDFRNDGPATKAAIDIGLLGGEAIHELRQWLPDPSDIAGASGPGGIAAAFNTKAAKMLGKYSGASFYRENMRKLYGAEDAFFKVLIFKHFTEKGMSPQQAVDEANRYIFDYRDLPRNIQRIRDSAIGIPFISYTYKAIPAIAHSLLTRPWVAAKYAALFNGINALAFAIGGDDDEEKERKFMPKYMQGWTPLLFPTHIRMMNDSAGNPQYLNIARLTPLGTIFSASNQQGVPMPSAFMPNHPIYQSILTLGWNRDALTGRDFFKPSDDLEDRTKKASKYLFQQLAPSTPLLPGTAAFDKMMNGVANAMERDIDLPVLGSYTGKVQGRSGREETLPKAAANTMLGINLRGFDPESQRQYEIRDAQREIGEILSNIRRESANQGISEAQRDKRIDNERKKLNKLTGELQNSL